MVESICIAVFGGSGKVGSELISIALKRGLRVKALYRPGSEPEKVPKGLEIIMGQLTDRGDIRDALEGTAGAICVFGPRLGKRNHPVPFCAEATEKIVEEMKKIGMDRLLVQTGAMAGGDSPNWSGAVRRFVRSYRKNYPKIDADRDAQEKVTKESGLDWTLVKPFRISGGSGKGKDRVRVAQNVHIGMFTSIRRSDLAEFLVGELKEGRFHRQAIYIVN